MRKPILAANWKMYKTIGEALDFLNRLKNVVGTEENKEIVVCPPFTALKISAEILKFSRIKLGAQNVGWAKEGAFTGEISPVMLKDVGCEYVIIGHSERRQYFGETDETVNRRLKAALAEGLIPIVCVGEKLAEREAGQELAVVENQVKNSLADLSPEDSANVVIAYEPVWAIGTGKTATPQQAQEMQKFIRQIYGRMYGEKVAENIRILYGGSIKPENISELRRQPDIDGGLVGGASLNVDSFVRIIRAS